MKEWVESQTQAGRYANASDYIRDLIRRDKDSIEYKAWFAAEVEKGYASGLQKGTIVETSKEAFALARTPRKKKSA